MKFISSNYICKYHYFCKVNSEFHFVFNIGYHFLNLGFIIGFLSVMAMYYCKYTIYYTKNHCLKRIFTPYINTIHVYKTVILWFSVCYTMLTRYA